MKVPINWLKELVTIPSDINVLTDKLTMVGHMLDKKSIVNDEIVLDLELRGNRADCYSIYGIAREVSAIFGSKVKLPKVEKLIKINKLKNSNLQVKTSLVKRAAMTEVYDVKITKSPDWLRDKIAAYGMESVNNIVDLTNYVMIEMGEPMHAFDLDKVKGMELEIRLAKNNEKITTFQNEVLTLTDNDLVWTKGDCILSIAGAIGEKDNSISDTTKNILVEAANYDRANIRKSVYRHNLLTEAGIRHEKELDPNMVNIAIGRFLYLVKKYNWGTFDSTFYDYYPKKIEPWKVKLELKHLGEIGGLSIDRKEIRKILRNLDFGIVKFDKQNLEVEIPTYRTDVVLEEDLIEEILRIYGYENIPAHVLSLEIPNQITPKYITQEINLRNSASAVGFNEAISLSFVKENEATYNIHPQKAEATVISLINPPSPDNKNLRTTLLPNLRELAQKAIYERVNEVRLFEIGKIYYKYKKEYKEERKIGFILYQEESSFADFKSLVVSFFVKAGINKPTFVSEALLLPLSDSFEIYLEKVKIGFGGKNNKIYFAEIDLDSILGMEKKYQVNLWPKFPPQIEDMTFTFPERTMIGEVINTVKSVNQFISNIELKDTYKDSFTFRIWYQDPEKTMTDAEVEKIRKEILSSLKTKFGATIKE